MTRSPRGFRWVGVAVACIAAALVIANWPVATRFGLNYQPSSKRIPLYEKVINFLSRDLQTRRLAKEIVAGASTDEEKFLKMFSWVTEHVRPTPPGFPVVDDHPLHILIRGYGASDQRTEAFVLLTGYAGIRAVSVKLRPPGSDRDIMVALVQWEGRTCVVDVVNRLMFRNEEGQLADLSELMAHPEWIAKASHGLVLGKVPYTQYLLELRHHQKKTFSRTDAQRTWARFKQELARAWR